MMHHDHEINSKIDSLKRDLELPALKRQEYKNDAVEDADVLWNCSRFLASALHQAELSPGPGSVTGFDGFRQEFESQHQLSIDTADLFSRHWLRMVNGDVMIAGTVSYACMTFEDIIPYRGELLFLRQLQELDPKTLKISKNDFDSLVARHQNDTGIALNVEGLYFNRYCKVEGDEVSFSDVAHYYGPYLDNWDTFRFLSAYKDALEDHDDRFVIISGAALEQLVATFKLLYPAFPDLDSFLADKVFVETADGNYAINFNDEKSYWRYLSDRVAGQLWELQYRDAQLPDHQESLKQWISKTKMLDCHDALELCSVASKRSFCDEAYTLLLNEKDLWGASVEMQKMLLDTSATRGDTNAVLNYPADLTGDIFHIYRELTDAYGNSMNFLVDQRSRNQIIKLISAFVLHEDGFGTESSRGFGRIRELLAKGTESPFLLWRISYKVSYARREIIPYLLTDKKLASLGFILIDTLEYPLDASLHNCRIWVQSMQLFLEGSHRFSFGTKTTAMVLYQAFLVLNADKYSVRSYQRTKKRLSELEKMFSEEERERQVLDTISNAKGGGAYILPQLLDELAILFSNHAEMPRYKNGLVQFPMVKWDGLFWLMEVMTYYRFQEQLKGNDKTSRTITDRFLESYLGLMETQQTTVTDFRTGDERKGFLSWSEKMERIAKLKWLYPIYNLNRFGLLSHFLSPRITIATAEDKYDEGNRVKASQLRTHIGVLLQLVKSLFSPSIPFGFERTAIENIKNAVEKQLIDYISHYSTEDPASGKIDLFSLDREEAIYSSHDEALLPQLAQLINRSANRESIISALQGTGDVVKLLTIGEFITSEGIRHKLLSEAKQTDVLPLLEQQLWIPEVQSILLKVSRHPELTEMLEDCLVYYEINTEKRAMPNDVRTAFSIRLLLAYMKRDEGMLEREKVPTGIARDSGELSLADYKEFYRGLIHMVEEPEKAYHIFTDLSARYPKLPALAINRFTAAFNLAEKENSSTGLSNALEQWKESTAAYSQQELLYLEPEASILLLNVYHQLNQYEDLDTLFAGLDLPYKMLPSVLDVLIDSLLARDRRAEAFYWLDQAKQYHQFEGQDDLQFLTRINDKISGEEKIEDLTLHYNRIFNSPAELLVRVLPSKLNGKVNLTEFAVQEFVLAADKMLDKIKSISAIDDEDKYNDLMEVLLEGRVNGYGWRVSGQKRAGHSGALGPNPGERDLPLYGADNKLIINCEALVYRGKGTALPHLKKMFNYIHQKEAMLVIFYDTGKKGKDFGKNWQEYQDKIVPACTFPDDYKPVDKIEDVTAEYKMQHSAIKVGRLPLQSGGVMYHLFIHINYFK